MANKIASARNYTGILDEVYQRSACSTVLNSPKRLIRAGRNAKEVMIPKVSVTGLGNYTRNVGYKTGSIEFAYETKAFNYDRGIRLMADVMDVEEAGVMDCFVQAGAELQRTQVAPEADLRGPAGGEGAQAALPGTVHLVDGTIAATNNSSSFLVPHGELVVGDLVIDANMNLGRVTAVSWTQIDTDRASVEFVVDLRPARLGTTENVLVEPGVETGSTFVVTGPNLGVGDLALSLNTGCLMRITRLAVGYSDRVEAHLMGVCSFAMCPAMLQRVTRDEMEQYVEGKLAALADLSGVYF